MITGQDLINGAVLMALIGSAMLICVSAYEAGKAIVAKYRRLKP